MARALHITADHDVFLGEDKEIHFGPVYASSGLTDAQLAVLIAAGTATPVDASTWDLIWVLRRKDKTADPALIEKATGSPVGITVEGTFNASQALNTQDVVVALVDTDSYDPTSSPAVALRAGKYRHSLKRTEDGSETILAFGDFRFLQATAR